MDKMKKIKESLKILETGISADGNLRKFLITRVNEEMEEDDLLKFDNELNGNIFKIKELIASEEKDMIIAYKRIKTSGAYLLGLIDQVLNLSKIESGNMELNKSEIIIEEFINDMMDYAKTYNRSKGKGNSMKVDFLIDDSAPFDINADRQKLKQVLLNFISNAIKFTEKGNVTIHVKKHQNNLKFSVLDTGKGINKEDIQNLFKEFERTKDSFAVWGHRAGPSYFKKVD